MQRYDFFLNYQIFLRKIFIKTRKKFGRLIYVNRPSPIYLIIYIVTPTQLYLLVLESGHTTPYSLQEPP